MKILISPAKSLNLEKLPNGIKSSDITFRNEAWEIAKVLKQKTPKELSELMGISDKLANLNWSRNQDYTKEMSADKSKQAIFAFNGEVFNGIDVENMTNSSIEYLQKNLRILSGQYGILKPLDLIMPYRLEMGTKLPVNNSKNLYDFWGNKITNEINSELTDDDIVVNLASNEYFKSIKENILKAQIVTPIFKDYKNGKLKTISFFAKKARGLMVRYMAENNISENIELLKEFNAEGYIYDPKLSNKKKLTFIR
jgi:cytoplasmic iron level regulating protein YaaA (DUF328/UPF0246 family)